MLEFMILVSVFLATWLGVVGTCLVVAQRSRVQERLTAMAGSGGVSVEESFTPAGTPGDFLGLEALLRGNAFGARLRQDLWRAGMKIGLGPFLALSAGAALFTGVMALAITRAPAFGLFAGGLAGLAPFLTMWQRQSKRRAAFEEQLPDALVLASSSLRTGYSFLQALQVVAKELPSPVSEEAQRVVDEVRVGFSQEEALRRLVDRMQSYDVDLLVTAITIQSQVGGNLAELMDTLAETIRDRFKMKGEIAAMSAEGRLSGNILYVLPVILLVALTFLNPDYMRRLFEHPLGHVMLLAAFVLQLVGGLILHRMVSIDT